MDMRHLDLECRSYSRYFTGLLPTAYVIEKYKDFHLKADALDPSGRFDRFLLSISARGPRWTRLADSYASVFARRAVLRKKLVVLLAILECAPPAFEQLDRVPSGGPLGAALGLAAGAARYAFTLAAGALLFLPVRLWMGGGER